MTTNRRSVLMLALFVLVAFAATVVWIIASQSDHPAKGPTSVQDDLSADAAPQPNAGSGGTATNGDLTAGRDSASTPAVTQAESAGRSRAAESTELEQAKPTVLEEKQDPEPQVKDDDFVIDFVRKDVDTVMHYFGLRSNLDLIVEGNIDLYLTVLKRITKREDPEEQEKEFRKALRQICEANGLDMIETGTTIIIKKKAGPEPEPTVTAGTFDGRWNVNFENSSAWAAAGECAKLMKVGLSLPLQREQDAELKFSIYMREATPSAIMQRIAAEAGMEVIETTENGAPHFEFRRR